MTTKEQRKRNAERARKWRAENPERTREIAKKSRDANRETVNAANARWRKENPDKAKASAAAWRKNNPETVRENRNRWARENADRMRPIRRAQYAANRDKIRARAKELSDATKRRIVDLHGGICLDCGFDGPLAAFEFHHTKDNKKFNISSLYKSPTKWRQLVKEAKKCDLLCANCHRIRHDTA